MANYKAKYLQQTDMFLENDSFDMTFVIFDENYDIVTDLSGFKFKCEITDGSQEIKKRDANYADGADSQISVSGSKVTVHITGSDSDNFAGMDYVVELQMENKTSGNIYTVYRKIIIFNEEELDW